MPIPFAAFLPGISQTLSSGINAAFQIGQNKAARRFANWQYDKQRQDSLTDWAMQNEYNSPAAQMERLKQAGLNPNLVYGHGADATSGPIRSSDSKSWNPKAPEVHLEELGNIYGHKLQYAQTQVQTDNLRTQMSVMEADKRLKDSMTLLNAQNQLKSAAETSKIKVERQQLVDMFQINLDAAMANVNKINSEIEKNVVEKYKTAADYQFTIDQNVRNELSNAMTLRQAAATILKIKAETAKTQVEQNHLQAMIKLLQTETKNKELDNNLKDKGIMPNDWWGWRKLQSLFKELSDDATNTGHSSGQYGTEY